MSEQLTVPPERSRSPFAEFVTGFLAGIGALLLTWFLTLFVLIMSKIPGTWETHFFAIVWALLFFSCGVFIELLRRREKRSSVFLAGLITSTAIFLLLETACWNFRI